MYEDLLPHTLPTETERLDAMGRAHDPDAQAAIARLGLPPAPHCLDIGSGRGTMAIWLAETWPDGTVVAGDLDHNSFKPNQCANLRLEVMDANTADLGEGVYDLIHCRALLCFLPDKLAVLKRIARALKPRGALVVTEMDFGRIAAGPSRFWASFWTAYLEFADAQEWDFRFGARLPRLLAQAGFTAIDARHIAPMLNLGPETDQTAGAAETRTWSLTLATLAPRLLDGGFMPEPMLRDALALIRNQGAWTPGPGFMMATARRPVGQDDG